MRRFLSALALVVAVVGLALPVAAAPEVNVTQAPPATLQVGEPFDLTAAAPTGGERYLLTLTMVDLETGNNADVEAWVPTSAGQLVPGGGGPVSWNGKAGKAGKYRLYVTAVPLDHPAMVTSSAPRELTVTSAPAPYSGPLIVVAAAEPVIVALAIGWVLARRRRASRIS